MSKLQETRFMIPKSCLNIFRIPNINLACYFVLDDIDARIHGNNFLSASILSFLIKGTKSSQVSHFE